MREEALCAGIHANRIRAADHGGEVAFVVGGDDERVAVLLEQRGRCATDRLAVASGDDAAADRLARQRDERDLRERRRRERAERRGLAVAMADAQSPFAVRERTDHERAVRAAARDETQRIAAVDLDPRAFRGTAALEAHGAAQLRALLQHDVDRAVAEVRGVDDERLAEPVRRRGLDRERAALDERDLVVGAQHVHERSVVEAELHVQLRHRAHRGERALLAPCALRLLVGDARLLGHRLVLLVRARRPHHDADVVRRTAVGPAETELAARADRVAHEPSLLGRLRRGTELGRRHAQQVASLRNHELRRLRQRQRRDAARVGVGDRRLVLRAAHAIHGGPFDRHARCGVDHRQHGGDLRREVHRHALRLERSRGCRRSARIALTRRARWLRVRSGRDVCDPVGRRRVRAAGRHDEHGDCRREHDAERDEGAHREGQPSWRSASCTSLPSATPL